MEHFVASTKAMNEILMLKKRKLQNQLKKDLDLDSEDSDD